MSDETMILRRPRRIMKPAIIVTVRFDEKPHKKADRERMTHLLTKVVGKYSRLDRGQVRVDFEYTG